MKLKRIVLSFLCFAIDAIAPRVYNEMDICDIDQIRDSEGVKICPEDLEYSNDYEEGCHYEYPIIEILITCSDVNRDNLERYIDSWDASLKYPYTLKLTNSHIPVWPTSIFKNKEALSALYLEHLGINKLLPGAFNFLLNLKELYLKGNKLTAVSDGIFNSLTLLETLDLSGNQIENISTHAFVGGRINYLLLNNNNLSRIEQDLLDSLTDVKTLDITSNNLKQICNFSSLPLHNLGLSNNLLDTVDFGLLQTVQLMIDLSINNITKLENFYLSIASTVILSHNNIKTIEKNDNVINLDISYNQLEVLDSNLFGSKLKELHANNNLIFSINVDSFTGLHNLENLVLSNNKLTFISNSCLRNLSSLRFLDVSGNQLTYFKYGTFDNLVNLESLNISNNKLAELQEHVLHALNKLEYLDFRNNEIQDINIDELLQLQNLKEVEIDGNVYSCKKLVYVIRKLNDRQILFSNGQFTEESNIHGIKCYDNSENSVQETKADVNSRISQLDSLYNEDFTKTIMYKYFNTDFRNSNFFKYLESLNDKVNDSNTLRANLSASFFEELLKDIKSKLVNESFGLDFKKSAMYNYFNQDFKESAFFKFLEGFKNQELKRNNSQVLTDNKLEEIIELLKNITKPDLPKTTKTLNNSQLNMTSGMNSYFNKDFKSSNFFRYLENLNKQVFFKDNTSNRYFNDAKMEKLISTFQLEKETNYKFSYTGLLSFIAILLSIIICVLLGSTYLNFLNMKKTGFSPKENVELL